MGKGLERILHVFLPNRCLFCDTPLLYDKTLCEDCERQARTTDLSRCLLCGKSTCICKFGFQYMLAPFYYDMGADRAVKSFKFHENFRNGKRLGGYMAACITQTGLQLEVDLILPVPLYRSDLRERGFNQAEILALAVGDVIGKPVHIKALRKTRITAKQHELSETNRKENLKGAFSVASQESLLGKRLLLVDDVCTTGSTFAVCTEVLLKSGATSVICLAAAKTYR